MSGWAEVLDDMEQRVIGTHAMLTEGAPPPPDFVLPADLGPLPAALLSRAAYILAATVEAEHHVEEAKSRLAGAMGRRPEPPVRGAFVDRRG